jgi:ribosomal protein S8
MNKYYQVNYSSGVIDDVQYKTLDDAKKALNDGLAYGVSGSVSEIDRSKNIPNQEIRVYSKEFWQVLSHFGWRTFNQKFNQFQQLV